jgi:hypothetical protein
MLPVGTPNGSTTAARTNRKMQTNRADVWRTRRAVAGMLRGVDDGSGVTVVAASNAPG